MKKYILVCRLDCTRNLEQITNDPACFLCVQGERGVTGPEGSQGAIGERVTLNVLHSMSNMKGCLFDHPSKHREES